MHVACTKRSPRRSTFTVCVKQVGRFWISLFVCRRKRKPENQAVTSTKRNQLYKTTLTVEGCTPSRSLTLEERAWKAMVMKTIHATCGIKTTWIWWRKLIFSYYYGNDRRHKLKSYFYRKLISNLKIDSCSLQKILKCKPAFPASIVKTTISLRFLWLSLFKR